MTAVGNHTIYVRKPTIVIDPVDNTTIEHFNPPSSVTAVKGCDVQPFLLAEKLQHEITSERLYSRSTKRVYAPSSVVTLGIRPEDEIEFKGQVFEVFGHVGGWDDLNGLPDHVSFIIMLREG